MFLVGDELSQAVSEILREKTCRCAVAFWGKGASKKLGKGVAQSKIICNLRSGGTNPFEVEKLRKKSSVKQCDTLHAKVYIGAKRSVISSANVSSNGLGLEDIEQAHWVEAGVVLDTTPTISTWFEKLWKNSREISSGDLTQAKDAWKRRQRSKPAALSFASFDPDQAEVPLLYWVSDDDYEFNEKAIKAQLGVVNAETKKLIDDSLEVDKQDWEIMSPGKWIVVWEYKEGEKGLPKKRPKPYWFFTGRRIDKSFRYTNEQHFRDSVLKADMTPNPPFDFNVPEVLDSFIGTLSDDQFSELRADWNGGFYTEERMSLIRSFWKKCKENYLSNISTKLRR